MGRQLDKIKAVIRRLERARIDAGTRVTHFEQRDESADDRERARKTVRWLRRGRPVFEGRIRARL